MGMYDVPMNFNNPTSILEYFGSHPNQMPGQQVGQPYTAKPSAVFYNAGTGQWYNGESGSQPTGGYTEYSQDGARNAGIKLDATLHRDYQQPAGVKFNPNNRNTFNTNVPGSYVGSTITQNNNPFTQTVQHRPKTNYTAPPRYVPPNYTPHMGG